MSQGDFVPRQDAKLSEQLLQFNAVCQSHATELGLDAAALELIQSASDLFSEEMARVVSQRAAYNAAVTQKDTQREASVQILRRFARIFKADPDVSESLLAELGVVRSRRSGPVTAVVGLVARGSEDGVNALRFSRNGNAPGTAFIIEYSEFADGPWSLAGVTTRTRFLHPGNVPGQAIWYRVTSMRAGENSVPTPPVALYSGLHLLAPTRLAA